MKNKMITTFTVFISISFLSACNVKESLADFSQATKDFGDSLKFDSAKNNQAHSKSTAKQLASSNKSTSTVSQVKAGSDTLNELIMKLNNFHITTNTFEVANIKLGDSLESVKIKHPKAKVRVDMGNINIGTEQKQLRLEFHSSIYTKSPVVSRISLQQDLAGANVSECKQRKKQLVKRLISKYGKPKGEMNMYGMYWGSDLEPFTTTSIMNSKHRLNAIVTCGNIGNLSLYLDANSSTYFTALETKISKLKMKEAAASKPVINADF